MSAGFSLSFRGAVVPEWIDINDHMNVSWYDRLFDRAERTFFEEFGIGDAYILRTGLSVFRLERLVVYERELRLGDRVEVRSRVLWTDMRRVHHFHELWNMDAGYRAAISDAVSIHVDLNLRKSTAMELPDVVQPLRRLLSDHAAAPPPPGVLARQDGRRVRS